jgi:hypothetical protein
MLLYSMGKKIKYCHTVFTATSPKIIIIIMTNKLSYQKKERKKRKKA